MTDRARLHAEILREIEIRLAGEASRAEKLQTVCDLLHGRLAYYNWVGLYLRDGDKEELVLGPFAGEATEHTRIAFGQGICGQAAARNETVVVDDVSKETNYLACSLAVKSEIVVPLLCGDRVVGELDIDSHAAAAFSPEDRALCEAIAERVAALF